MLRELSTRNGYSIASPILISQHRIVHEGRNGEQRKSMTGIDCVMRLLQACLKDSQGVVLCIASIENNSTGVGKMVDWIWSCWNASGEQFEVAVEV